MNEMPGVVIIRALGRINKYDSSATDGGAIFSSPVEIRVFAESANVGRARAATVSSRLWLPDLSRAYKSKNISVLWKNYNSASRKYRLRGFFIAAKYITDRRDWFMSILAGTARRVATHHTAPRREAAGLITRVWVSDVKYWISVPYVPSSSH